jgi:hypothetical protein
VVASGSSVVHSDLLWFADKKRGMNAKEHGSEILLRTPDSSPVRRKELIGALVVEKRSKSYSVP